jgi:hypothetical protein
MAMSRDIGSISGWGGWESPPILSWNLVGGDVVEVSHLRWNRRCESFSLKMTERVHVVHRPLQNGIIVLGGEVSCYRFSVGVQHRPHYQVSKVLYLSYYNKREAWKLEVMLEHNPSHDWPLCNRPAFIRSNPGMIPGK